MRYRYRPADNRTPVNHPVFGHLEWDTIVDDDRCASDPNFEPVRARAPKAKKPRRAKPTPKPAEPAVPASPAIETSQPPADTGNQTPVETDTPAADPAVGTVKPPAEPADADHVGQEQT